MAEEERSNKSSSIQKELDELVAETFGSRDNQAAHYHFLSSPQSQYLQQLLDDHERFEKERLASLVDLEGREEGENEQEEETELHNTWKKTENAGASGKKERTIRAHVQKLVKIIGTMTGGDIDYGLDLATKVQEKLKNINTNLTEVDEEIVDVTDTSMDTVILNNINSAK